MSLYGAQEFQKTHCGGAWGMVVDSKGASDMVFGKFITDCSWEVFGVDFREGSLNGKNLE